MTEIAERYLRHAIAAGTPPARAAELTMHGDIRTSPTGAWMPYRATESIAYPDGFLWRASAGRLLRITGSDEYRSGAGAMRWKLWGVIPVVSASGDDTSRSARGRFAMEAAAWLPSILLDADWAACGPDSVQTRLAVDGEECPLRFEIAADGALRRMTLDRWGNVGTPGGAYQRIPFAVTCAAEKTFDGYTIPVRLAAGWRPDSSDYFEFIRMEVDTARYR